MFTQLALPAAWSEVLEKVRNALATAETEAAVREQSLQIVAQPPERAAEHEAIRQRHLNQLEEGLRRLQAVLQQAEQEASSTDAAVASEEELLGRWHAALTAIR
jgi:hypothetical protein